MKELEKDILRNPDLKKIPYSVPEGYFDSFRKEVSRYTEPQQMPVVVNIWSRMMPFLAMAAMFAIMVTAGTFFLEKTTDEAGPTQEDYIVFSDQYIDIDIYKTDDEQYADSGVDSEDIIKYLIYTGVDEHTIELSKH